MESVMKRTTATGFLSTCAISLALFSSCTSVEPNTLTPEEIADGWQLPVSYTHLRAHET